MKSMLNPFTNPGPDSPTETIQAEIDALRAFGANQMPDKHKEIDLLAKAYKELEGMGYGSKDVLTDFNTDFNNDLDTV